MALVSTYRVLRNVTPSQSSSVLLWLCVFVFVSDIDKKVKVLSCRCCVLYLCSVLSPVCWWHPGLDLCDVSGSSSCRPCLWANRCGQKTHGLDREMATEQPLWHCDAGSKLQMCGFEMDGLRKPSFFCSNTFLSLPSVTFLTPASGRRLNESMAVGNCRPFTPACH